MDPEIGPTSVVRASRALTLQTRILRRVIAVGLGAAVVAASAQFVVPMPFSPVPMTLQPLAVLVVGGLLGGAAGLGALLLYLALGVLGLPVFAAGGSGLLHLMGPTGGYLIAFPLAAGVAGALTSSAISAPGVRPGGVLRVLLSCALGMVIIHAGGVAQLALLGGNPLMAFRVGFVPFLTGDLIKVGLAAALILAAGPKIRSIL
jgi:biotin transport system substrate-specific component